MSDATDEKVEPVEEVVVGQSAEDIAARNQQPLATGTAGAAHPTEQSGVPLAEDVAAGVTKGTVPDPPAAPVVAATPQPSGGAPAA